MKLLIFLVVMFHFVVAMKTMQTTILAIEQQYSQNASLIGDAIDDLNEHGPPQHAWNMVAPGTAEQQARDQDEGVQVERDIDQEDLHGCQCSTCRTTQCSTSSEVHYGDEQRSPFT